MELVTATNIYFERKFEAPVPMKECLAMCAQSGYHKLDFGFAELELVSKKFATDLWREELLEYKAFAEDKGLSFVQAHATILDFCNPGEDFERKEELFRRSILGAKMLGASWIVVHPSTKVRDGKIAVETHEKNVAFFRKYAEFAKDVGIGLAIENMWGTTREGIENYAVQPEEVLRLLKDIDRENVRLCWDVEHGSIQNIDQKKALDMLKDYLVTTHISDETGVNNIHILPGFGRIDWTELMEIFAEINYEGIFDFEIQHYLPGVPKELVPGAMRFSYEVGNYLIEQMEKIKKIKGMK